MSKKIHNSIRSVGLFIISLLFFHNGFAQILTESNLYYEGFLKITKQDSLALNLFIHLENGVVTNAFFDSPDQYVYDIPISKHYYGKDSIYLEASSVGGTFIGKPDNKGNLVGFFKQNRSKKKITLYHQDPALRIGLIRPQTPKPPFPYSEKEIIICDPTKKEPDIVGTLTAPSDRKAKATIIMITGSGWQNRDEFIMGHSPFWVIADYLSRNGYAVFRYDDRPIGIFRQSTSVDFAEDVNRIAAYFEDENKKEQREQSPIGLLGHSEGGMIAFMVASNNSNIDFCISMAGCSAPISHILLYQIEAIMRAENEYSEEEIQKTISISAKTYQIMEKAKSETAINDKFTALMKEYTQNMSEAEKERLNLTPMGIVAQLRTLNTPWFRTLFKINPKKYLKKTECPCFALNGEKDLQVDYKENLELFRQYLPTNKHHQFRSYPNLNHLFQETDNGLPKEYGELEQTISPVILQDIKDWLDKMVESE